MINYFTKKRPDYQTIGAWRARKREGRSYRGGTNEKAEACVAIAAAPMREIAACFGWAYGGVSFEEVLVRGAGVG